MVQVVRIISIYDMNSENIWFSSSKPLTYREKLICHACDGGRTEEQEIGTLCSVLVDQKPQYKQKTSNCTIYTTKNCKWFYAIGAPAIGAPALSSGAPIAGAPIAALQRQGDFIDLLFKQMQTCKCYICSIFLQSDL